MDEYMPNNVRFSIESRIFHSPLPSELKIEFQLVDIGKLLYNSTEILDQEYTACLKKYAFIKLIALLNLQLIPI